MANTITEIVVIEDETDIRDLLVLVLSRQGYRVTALGSAVGFREQLQEKNWDLVVLDWMLPQVSGLQVLQSLASLPTQVVRPPVLMVTAKAEPADIVAGLEAGADDYLTKPFDPNVLLARVKALLRRSSQAVAGRPEILQMGDIVMDLGAHEVKIAGGLVHLTPSEFKILHEMGLRKGRVLTREQLIAAVQGEGISVTGRTIDTHVFGLRKKLGASADWIETIRGVGYRIKSE